MEFGNKFKLYVNTEVFWSWGYLVLVLNFKILNSKEVRQMTVLCSSIMVQCSRGSVNINLAPLICPLRDCLFELQILLNLLSSKNLSKNIFLHHTILFKYVLQNRRKVSRKKFHSYLSSFLYKGGENIEFLKI